MPAHYHSFYLYITDDDYVQSTLSKCSERLYDLTACLAEQKTLIFEIKKCDGLLAKAFTCLSPGPGVSLRHTHAMKQSNRSVSKRGLGRCIHTCLKARGGMNFIQCKSMCR